MDNPVDPTTVDNTLLAAAAMALAARRAVVLSGAGISTHSGIPDYRGPLTRHRPRSPVRYDAFVRDAHARRRYWARALLGWPRLRDATPNPAHWLLTAAAKRGAISGIITQNVDGLHHKAHSPNVVELHGNLGEVLCLSCSAPFDRETIQAQLLARNPNFAVPTEALQHAPDGDVDLHDEQLQRFVVVDCEHCGGILKPRVTFFGENVTPATLAQAWRVFDAAQALLVLGSSLEVWSGRRFVVEAHQRGWPIVMVNLGPVRSSELATVAIDGDINDVLPQLLGHP